ncbi:MAG: DUF3499 family protein [Acidimicrobiia bacterium]|nr:DUF3499 family protein [Acidimicrobiia bacterium]
MTRVCSRPGCSAPASVTFSFEPAKLTVWIGDLSDDDTGPGHDLCVEHGDRLSPPRGWTLNDLREGRAELPTLDANSPMLARAFRAAHAS